MDGQPTTMPEREPQVERYEDMSPDGRLRLIQQEDGDVIVVIVPPSEKRAPMMAVEFCTFAGGGQSPHTREALIGVMEAMRRDNAEREQFRD